MIGQFFILSPRGDTIISKQYRGDVVSGTSEIFFRKVKFWKGDAPPVFVIDGINFLFIKRNGLYFVATTRFNVSPSMTIELLDRVAKVFKDYCGVLSEESIRKNFILVYELLDELVDYGYAQGTTTETLKAYVYNEPIVIASDKSGGFKMPSASSKSKSASAVHAPIALGGRRKGKKNEIFVDILERLNVIFNANGYVLNSTIDGSIQMKSYLTGNPPLRIALNEDLVVGKGASSGYGAVVLDDCNFHEVVNLDEFEASKVMTLVPPDGEFVVMNYRITSDFRAPFRVFPFVEETSAYKVEVVLKVRADIPPENYGANVLIRFPVPRTSATVTPEVGPSSTAVGPAAAAGAGGAGGPAGEQAEYRSKDKQVLWLIKKFQGGTEHTLRTKITLSAPSTTNIRKEIGPISLNFEIPMYNVSSLQVKYLRIAEASKSYKPHRWVRGKTTGGAGGSGAATTSSEAAKLSDALVVVTAMHDVDERPDVYGDLYNRPQLRKARVLAALEADTDAAWRVTAPSTPAEFAGDGAAAAAVHDAGMLAFLRDAWKEWVALGWRRDTSFAHPSWDGEPPLEGEEVADAEAATPPLVPAQACNRDALQRPGRGVMPRCGYYATDRFTPIYAAVAGALRWDAAALAAAVEHVRDGGARAAAYCLLTHPGHHAAAGSFGGYCYINSAAVAARMLQAAPSAGRVAIVDVDYHAGNGTMSIFWDDPTVLVATLHADPDIEYPFNVGFADQTGSASAEGATLCVPLPARTSWEGRYRAELLKVLERVAEFGAAVLVVSLGVDTADGDHVVAPGAGFTFSAGDFREMGAVLESAALPTLIVQEGGYADSVGESVHAVLRGFRTARAKRT